MEKIKLTDIYGIQLGHSHSVEGTGVSVIICKDGATGGVAVRGGAPGTRETDLLNPMEMVQKIHAVVLAGGSAFGLDASSGVMEYLENHNIGFDVGVAKVPIVSSAVLFDLTFGNPKIRPDKEMGLQACINSESYNEDIQGNIGAGYGAVVGKYFGLEYSMKSGLGTSAYQIGDLQIGAIVAVNCLGDVKNPRTNEFIAGAYDRKQHIFLNTEQLMIDNYKDLKDPFKGNTTIGIIITNAKLDKAQANKLASMAHNGFARTIYPSHTMYDGDTIFCLGTNQVNVDITLLGMLLTNTMEQAILNAVTNAESLKDTPSYKEINK
ncbi:MAG: P1 family peptidase [Candidatus Cloacimonetes bacterium]|nr:P1 family peptidase [Candidatus Cloacimonadota bacterium]MDD4155330.1 P1 family peptidase [Candidatus Cloacimonadota bacterium]